jgi:hypothetical protein
MKKIGFKQAFGMQSTCKLGFLHMKTFYNEEKIEFCFNEDFEFMMIFVS